MNRLRASRLSVAWLFLAGLLSAALIPLAGCGGETGGITSGVGGALLNVRVQTFVATLSVGTEGTLESGAGLPGVVAAIGRDSSGKPATKFDLILKGASYDSQDVILPFNVNEEGSEALFLLLALQDNPDDNPDNGLVPSSGGEAIFLRDGKYYFASKPTEVAEEGATTSFLYLAKKISDNSSMSCFKRGGKYYTIPKNPNDTIEELSATNYTFEIRPLTNAKRYLSKDSTQILRKGSYDVVLRFSGSNDEDYWRVYYKAGALVDLSQNEVTLSFKSDAALTYSSAAEVFVPVTGIGKETDSVKVRLREIPVNSDTVGAAFEVETNVKDLAGDKKTIRVPVINRLRKFSTEIEAIVKDSGKDNIIAWSPSHVFRKNNLVVEPKGTFEIPVNESLKTVEETPLYARVTRLSIATTDMSQAPTVSLASVQAIGFTGNGEVSSLFALPPDRIDIVPSSEDANFRDYINHNKDANTFESKPNRPAVVTKATAKFNFTVVVSAREADLEKTPDANASFEWDPEALSATFSASAESIPGKAASVVFQATEVGNRKFNGDVIDRSPNGWNEGKQVGNTPVVDRKLQFRSLIEAFSEKGGRGFVLARGTGGLKGASTDAIDNRVVLQSQVESVEDVLIRGQETTPRIKRGETVIVSAKFKMVGVDAPSIAPHTILTLTLDFTSSSIPSADVVPEAHRSNIELRDGSLKIKPGLLSSKRTLKFLIRAEYPEATNTSKRNAEILCEVIPNLGDGEGEIKIGGGGR